MRCEQCSNEMMEFGNHYFCQECDIIYPKNSKIFYAKRGEEKMTKKATAYNLVVSDKGKKATRIGVAFFHEEKNPQLSITLSIDALKKALKDGTVSEQVFKGNPKYPDAVLDGSKTVRIAGFVKGKQSNKKKDDDEW